jgi:type II secretory pathway predicted ATPase ExeA
MSEKTPRLETQLRSFFAFKSIPFAKNLEPHRLFGSATFHNGLDRLRYLVDRGGIGAIFGTPGCGKSTLLRHFLDSLGKATHSVCYVDHSTCATLDLYRLIAQGFQIEPRYRRADVLREIKERVSKLSRVQKLRVVLVIDDAHLLPHSFLDELRLLTSFEQDSRDDLTLIISGHPQLESKLRLAVNEALAQRIVMRVRLRSFHPEEVEKYLDFRLGLAGRTAKLFLPDAVEAIVRASRGVPRLIDRIAEHCLLIALKGKKKEIDGEIVTDAVDEVEP